MIKINKGTKGKLKRATPILMMVFMILTLAFVILWSKIKFGASIICPAYYFFNWHCPGCGITRMCEASFQGNLLQAFRYNPFIFVTAPILTIVFIWQFIDWVWNGHVSKHFDKFLIIYALLLTLFGVIRNIDGFMFLSPTTI